MANMSHPKKYASCIKYGEKNNTGVKKTTPAKAFITLLFTVIFIHSTTITIADTMTREMYEL